MYLYGAGSVVRDVFLHGSVYACVFLFVCDSTCMATVC